jgi:hypothetical protein
MRSYHRKSSAICPVSHHGAFAIGAGNEHELDEKLVVILGGTSVIGSTTAKAAFLDLRIAVGR